MEETYEGNGLRFRYPAFWELIEQEDEESTSITVASPDTSFWSVSLFRSGPSPQQLIASAVEAFREEYDEVDVYPSDESMGDRPGVAQDVDFVCFELINSAFLRAFQTDRFTVLVLYQGFDGELAETRPLLEAISASLTLDGEESRDAAS
ncbi:MAG TPA: hypothetical protein VHX68_12825 [Planctomycetaceae bacterium]|jgi:hypothetical protein|nr:hypothetical protein [Planctomycetaceae bacterium]